MGGEVFPAIQFDHVQNQRSITGKHCVFPPRPYSPVLLIRGDCACDGRSFRPRHWGDPMVIFDCNGVLVDSEPLATAIVSQEFMRAGFPLTPDVIARYVTGRRAADMFAEVEVATGRKLPPNFAGSVASVILRRFRGELRATPNAEYALSWLRGPKCVASSSSHERIRVSLESTGLIRFFEPNLFSASEVQNGKPAPDLFLHVASTLQVKPSACIVVEDSPVGVAAGVAAGMTVIGFVGGSHAGGQVSDHLRSAGARAVISDLRALKRSVIDLRGW
jgi:HAD superfamily hydrolase (TIGR01509 family)